MVAQVAPFNRPIAGFPRLDRPLPLPIGPARMSLLAIPFPEIDPVALRLGPIAVKWYGLAYMAGLLLGWLYVKHAAAPDPPVAQRQGPLHARQGRRPPALHDGRRAGRRAARQRPVLRARLLLQQPAGDPRGLEGRHGLPRRTDRLDHRHPAVRAPGRRRRLERARRRARPPPRSGLFFGRLANFINGELWGRPSSVPWAMVFPGGRPHAAPSEPALRGGARRPRCCSRCCGG